MKMRGWIVVTLLLGLLCLTVQPALAGFKGVLFDAFCRPLPDKEKEGCNLYVQLRIIHDKNRSVSLEQCQRNCSSYYPVPGADKTNCDSGCIKTNQQDY